MARRVTVLVVDDDASIRRALCDELAAAGYDTVAAADGEEGEQVFEATQPDLVLTDLAMPRADGFVLPLRNSPAVWQTSEPCVLASLAHVSGFPCLVSRSVFAVRPTPPAWLDRWLAAQRSRLPASGSAPESRPVPRHRRRQC